MSLDDKVKDALDMCIRESVRQRVASDHAENINVWNGMGREHCQQSVASTHIPTLDEDVPEQPTKSCNETGQIT